MRYLILAILTLVALGFAAAPAQAQQGFAQIEADGQCNYNGTGGGDSVTITATSFPAVYVDGADSDNVQDGLAACADAASSGDTPDGGSYGAASASVFGTSQEVSTVPVTNAATDGRDDALQAAAETQEQAVQTQVTAEGACYDHSGGGAQDSATVGPDGASTPSEDNVQDGLAACGTAVSNGSAPAGGSYAAVDVTAAGQDARVSSVFVSGILPGSAPSPTVSAEGACWYDGAGAEDDASVSSSGDVDAPRQRAAMAALGACFDAASNGDLPDGGSYLAVSVDTGADEVTVSTVPVTDAATGALP